MQEIREDWKKKIRQNRTRNFYSTIFRIFLRKTCVEKGKKNEEQKIRNII